MIVYMHIIFNMYSSRKGGSDAPSFLKFSFLDSGTEDRRVISALYSFLPVQCRAGDQPDKAECREIKDQHHYGVQEPEAHVLQT